jgi:plasmid maintenance system antidote protein VapI
MAETTKNAASQVQQAFAGAESVKKMFEEQSTRVGQMFDELGKAHGKWIEYGNTQIDEMSELMKTQFNYVNELAAGWRKLSLETAKKAAETFKS